MLARSLSDPTRIRLLRLVLETAGAGVLVSDLAARLRLSQPTISHHVRVLTEDGILRRRPEGRRVWYSADPERLPEIHAAVRRTDPWPQADPDTVLNRIAANLSDRFAGTFAPETVSAYVRESYALLASGARIPPYLPSLVARFAADRLSALARAEQNWAGATPQILFVCVQNAGRSQLAAGIARFLAGERVSVRSAGSKPGPAVNADVVSVLDEVGIPLDGDFPKPLTDEVVRAADYVITMGCGDACPVLPGRRYFDWDLADPATLDRDELRALRNDIDQRVRGLLRVIDSDRDRDHRGGFSADS